MFSRNSHIPEWVGDLRAGRMLDANDAALKFWRMTLDQFLTTEIENFFQPEEVPRWETFIEQMAWGESGPWKCTRGDGTIFHCSTRWQMIHYQGVYCAFVFPLRAGDTPATMKELDFSQPQKGK
jgi:PAS domain-containing protein